MAVTFWASVWLAVILIATKAYYLAAATHDRGWPFVGSLVAISHTDVLFVLALWGVGRLALALAARSRPASRTVEIVFSAFAGFLCLYAVASVVVFEIFGGFLTYPLIALVGDVRMLSSSVAAYLTPPVVFGLIGVPSMFLALVWISVKRLGTRRPGGTVMAIAAVAWIAAGYVTYRMTWATRQERAIAETPPGVFLSSWIRAIYSGDTIQMNEPFDPSDLADFEPRPYVGSGFNRTKWDAPPNVVFIVFESVAARWTNLNGGKYDTTPSLVGASAQGFAAGNFYAHIGRSSNSLVALLLGIYPKLDFRDITVEYPHLPGPSLASVFQGRGYRTAFFTPSDLTWAGWGTFLEGRGFSQIDDYHRLQCPEPISSWGVEDRCMIDGILEYIDREPGRPFFVMGWTTQTHHPYEPTPGIPLLELVREPVGDEYELNRYLNVIRETDRHLGRLFDTLRRSGRDQNTIVVVVGDHGQGFGYPHEGNYTQGRTVYEEDVRVPLLIWSPRLYPMGARSAAIGGHVDLAPTLTDLVGFPPAPEWQGRSLFDPGHPRRAYFYVAEDRFKLGVREDQWKYIVDLRDAVDELYDLQRDPDEQHNVAPMHTDVTSRLRRRLAAWTEANRLQYERIDRKR